MGGQHNLGDLQYAIMRVLWHEGEATVARVHEVLGSDRERALTTIATMLAKMEKKGVVAHASEGRVFVYRPTIRAADVTRTMISDLTERLFEGDATALVSHLIHEREFDAEELERLRSLVDEHIKKERRHGR